MPILETDKLTRFYGALKAVDELTMSVEAGEVFGLLGPKGAGKTTLIKMLTTLLPPSSGSAHCAQARVINGTESTSRCKGQGILLR